MGRFDVVKVKNSSSENIKNDIPENLPSKFSFTSIVSKRMSGKTNIICWLIQNHLYNKYDEILILSPTCKVDPTWNSISRFKNVYFLDDVSPDDLAMIFEIQKQRSKNDKTLLLVLDDSGNESKFIPVLEKLACTGRHWKMSVIVTVQQFKLLSSVIRNNTKNWLIGKMNKKEQDKVFEELSALIDESTLRDQYLNITSKPFAFLNINENRPSKLLSRNFDP